MGTTAKGYPYPEGTDLVMEGDDAIEALAQAIDSKLPYAVYAAGVDIRVAAGSATGSGTLTYPSGTFSQAPITTVTITNSYWTPGLGSRTATSVQINIRRDFEVSEATTFRAHVHSIQQGTTPDALFAARALGGEDVGAPADVTVTCPTDGCVNAGIPIPINSTWEDEDGGTHPVLLVECGGCGTEITDTMAPIDGGA